METKTKTKTRHAGGRPRKYKSSVRAVYYGEAEIAAGVAALGGGNFSVGVALLYEFRKSMLSRNGAVSKSRTGGSTPVQ